MKQLFNVFSHYQRVKGWYKRHERWMMPASLMVGFLVDYLTFTSIQISTTFMLLVGYWVVAGVAILFIAFYDAKKVPEKLRYARLFAPLVIQFSFGSLLSSSLIFYWLSGAFSVSWPVILLAAGLMVFNEAFRDFFSKTMVQVGIYFFTTFSLISLMLPFMFNSLSEGLFLLAGGLSVAIFVPYIWLLLKAVPDSRWQRWQFLLVVLSITGLMNFFYFNNIIPPIPLSLREAGLYQSIIKSGDKYALVGEVETFWQILIPGQTLHVKPGQKMYLYTAIFAPVNLKATIVHDWQYYNVQTKEWESKDALLFTIFGGRQGGYQGYSWRSDLVPGAWRVYVKNQRGQVLGRVKFMVEKAEGEVQVQQIVR